MIICKKMGESNCQPRDAEILDVMEDDYQNRNGKLQEREEEIISERR